MITQQMKTNISTVVAKNIMDANAHYGLDMKVPKITYNLRGSTAGRAKLKEWEIQLNAILLEENIDEMTNETTPHEVAHLIDFKVNPENFESRFRTGRKRSIHGPTFKFILGQVLGCSNVSTTHRMDTSNASVKRAKGTRHVWISKQDGSEMILGPQRHRKMFSGFGRYWMRGCSNHTYEYSHIEGQEVDKGIPTQVTEIKIAAKTVKPKVTHVTITKPTETTSHIRPTIVPKTGTKKERAKVIFLSGATRQTFIQSCIIQLDMTKAGASTYYSNFNNGKW